MGQFCISVSLPSGKLTLFFHRPSKPFYFLAPGKSWSIVWRASERRVNTCCCSIFLPQIKARNWATRKKVVDFETELVRQAETTKATTLPKFFTTVVASMKTNFFFQGFNTFGTEQEYKYSVNH